jgi:hypothetical protein
MKLQKRLALDDAQTAKVREIFEKEQAAAVKDRGTFYNDALSLIKTAYDRKKEKEAQVEALLNPVQKEKFKDMVKMTRYDHDLFELTEGLMLNDEQAFTVEGILIDYYNKFKEMMPEGMRPGEGPGPGMPMPPPDKGMKPPHGFGPMKGMMKSIERKKNKAIKKVLTTGQKVLFEQIQKDRVEKRKEKPEIRNSKLETNPNDQNPNDRNSNWLMMNDE